MFRWIASVATVAAVFLGFGQVAIVDLDQIYPHAEALSFVGLLISSTGFVAVKGSLPALRRLQVRFALARAYARWLHSPIGTQPAIAYVRAVPTGRALHSLGSSQILVTMAG